MQLVGKPWRAQSAGWPPLRSGSALGLVVALGLLASGTAGGQMTLPAAEFARVPATHANVHKGPSSNDEVLVLVPQGTILPIVGRRGEWIEVQLSPALRESGIVMRWYANEDRGWMHDSTVETAPPPAP